MSNKIVLNRCYGGFGLSDQAVELYLSKKGITEWSKVRQCGMSTYVVPEIPNFYDKDIPRHDPDLIDVVEELGVLADGECASLVLYESDGEVYKITNYDGMETLHELDTGEWIVI